MSLLRMVRIIYTVYTLYVFLLRSSTTLTFYTVMPAVILMWANYCMFHGGYTIRIGGGKSATAERRRTWVFSRNRMLLLATGTLAMLSSIIAANFYTGQTPLGIIGNLKARISVYYAYQQYFSEQNIAALGFARLPYVVMCLFVKATFFYSFLSLLIPEEHLSCSEKAYLALVTLSHLYLGFARGTHVEFFELSIAVVFVLFSRPTSIRRFGQKLRTTFQVLVLGWVMGMVYYKGISARGVSFSRYITTDVQFDDEGLLPYVSQSLASILLIFYGYFGFGFYCTSAFLTEYWMASGERFLAGFFPLGFRLIGEPSVRTSMETLVDMGARWLPDAVLFIDYLGLLGLLALSFLLGLFARSVSRADHLHGVVELTHFMILFQMVSLPIGNFIHISSANTLIVVGLVATWSLNSIARAGRGIPKGMRGGDCRGPRGELGKSD